MRNRIPLQIKEKAMNAVREEGMTVKQASEQYGVSDKTIHYWFRKEAEENGGGKIDGREIQRLKKSNEDLLLIIGELTAELNKIKKKK